MGADEEGSEFERWMQEAEVQLEGEAMPNPRTGLIILRLFRRWYVHEWEPHKRREERYLWGLRAAVWTIALLGSVMAWALSTVVDAMTVLHLGSGGP